MPVAFLEKNTDKYGVIESLQRFDDIYPHRVGKVTAVDNNNPLVFTDADMPFDLNEADSHGTVILIDNVSPKVTFNTGQLAGYTFEVAKHGYNSKTKTFTLLKNKDEKAVEVPSKRLRPAIGDEYVVTDIKMPQAYVQAAEQQLQEKARGYLDKNCEYRCIYDVVADPIYFKEQRINIKLGDTCRFVDKDFGLDADLRVLSWTKDINAPWDVRFELGEKAVMFKTVREIFKGERRRKTVSQTLSYNAEMARRSYLFAEEINDNIFDGDGYFDPDKIKPLSIETKMLTVGSRSQQFALPDLILTIERDNTALRNTKGRLVHSTIADKPRTWNIPANFQTNINAEFHYIYIKAQRTGTNANVLVSTEHISLEQAPTYYHFEAGYLGSVQDGFRRIKLVHGFTQVSPGEITTGRISAANGEQYIDIEQDKIKMVGEVEFAPGSPAKQALDSVKTTADTAKTTADTAKRTADTAKSTADTAKSTAGTAKSTADTAKSTADTAKSTADTAKSTADRAKSTADTAKSTADTSAYLSQALGQSSSVKGGLVLSSVIAARDKSGTVHSYMSGDNSYNKTAFAAGVSNFGKSYEGKNIDILHDGSAKIGNLHIEENGNLYTEGSVRIGDLRLDGKGAFYMQDSAGVRRLQFDLSSLPTLYTLRSRAEIIHTASNSNKYFYSTKEETYFFPNAIYVSQNGSEVTISASISAQVPPYGSPPLSDNYRETPLDPEVGIRTIPNNASLSLTLVDSRNDDYAYLGSVSADNFPDSEGRSRKTSYDSKVINTVLKGVPSGYYKVKAEFYASEAELDISGDVYGLEMKSVFKNDLRQITIGKDGLMAFYGKDKHFYISENEHSDQPFLNVRGSTDMPGVLATASVNGKYITNAWGAKVRINGVYRNAVGKYHVYHHVGHLEYTVSVTCHTKGVVATVGGKSSNSFYVYMQRVGRDCDSGFDYVIYGKNDG